MQHSGQYAGHALKQSCFAWYRDLLLLENFAVRARAAPQRPGPLP